MTEEHQWFGLKDGDQVFLAWPPSEAAVRGFSGRPPHLCSGAVSSDLLLSVDLHPDALSENPVSMGNPCSHCDDHPGGGAHGLDPGRGWVMQLCAGPQLTLEQRSMARAEGLFPFLLREMAKPWGGDCNQTDH